MSKRTRALLACLPCDTDLLTWTSDRFCSSLPAMSITPDTDLRTAIQSTINPVYAMPVLQHPNGNVLNLSVAQFAEIYPALEQVVLSTEKDTLQIVALVFSRVNPPIDLTQIRSISPTSPSESTKMKVSAEADQLLGRTLHMDMHMGF
ncbi:hypothetical protein EDD85DRAFT_1021367 [Armillaria nabsnona]|nr:hypothetical protein EDD85DRAFT_1021367 [Armillaria nabsnona]